MSQTEIYEEVILYSLEKESNPRHCPGVIKYSAPAQLQCHCSSLTVLFLRCSFTLSTSHRANVLVLLYESMNIK